MWMKKVTIISLSTLLLPAMASAKSAVLKDPEGKFIATVMSCSSCKGEKGEQCVTGVEEGFDGEAPCGQCLMKSNFGIRISYAYDVLIMGHLKDEKGEPVRGRFVKLFLPNTWTVRTRTGDDGLFRVLLGATAERKGKPLVVQMGELKTPKDSKSEYYALFMVPENHKPCAPPQ
jgi:hypothetical protein